MGEGRAAGNRAAGRLDDRAGLPTYSIMDDRTAPYPPDPFGDGLTNLWRKGVIFARNLAIAGALAGLGGIVLGAVLTDSWLAQIFVTIFAAVVLWLPMLGLTVWASRLFSRRDRSGTALVDVTPNTPEGRLDSSWRRLVTAAPRQRERIVTLQRSLDRSRTSLAATSLDTDAHELCAMIDKRLPDLIDHDLDSLAPDSRGRERQVGELIDLVEQFVRHCGSKRDGAADNSAYQAEVLKRRFEARLNDDRPFDH